MARKGLLVEALQFGTVDILGDIGMLVLLQGVFGVSFVQDGSLHLVKLLAALFVSSIISVWLKRTLFRR